MPLHYHKKAKNATFRCIFMNVLLIWAISRWLSLTQHANITAYISWYFGCDGLYIWCTRCIDTLSEVLIKSRPESILKYRECITDTGNKRGKFCSWECIRERYILYTCIKLTLCGDEIRILIDVESLCLWCHEIFEQLHSYESFVTEFWNSKVRISPYIGMWLWVIFWNPLGQDDSRWTRRSYSFARFF